MSTGSLVGLHFRAAVFAPALLAVFAATRLGLAVGNRLNLGLGQQFLHVFFDDFGSAAAQFHVVGVCAALIAMAFDGHGGDFLFFQALGAGADAVLGTRRKRIFIEVKVHRHRAAIARGINTFAIAALQACAAIAIFGAAGTRRRCTHALRQHAGAIGAFCAGWAICVGTAFRHAFVGIAFFAIAAIHLVGAAIGFAPAGTRVAHRARVVGGARAIGVDAALRALVVHTKFTFGFTGVIVGAVRICRSAPAQANAAQQQDRGQHCGTEFANFCTHVVHEPDHFVLVSANFVAEVCAFGGVFNASEGAIAPASATAAIVGRDHVIVTFCRRAAAIIVAARSLTRWPSAHTSPINS